MPEYSRADTLFTSATNGVDHKTMMNAVWTDATITTLFLGMRSEEDDGTGDITYYFSFNAALSAPEETQLDALITAHTGKPAAPSALDQAKIDGKEIIDVAAGEARDRYITTAKGQEATYIKKGEDAQAYKDAGYPADETGYDYVTAEKNATGVTATVAADTILATAASWKTLGAQIEELRIKYKTDIDAETVIDNIEALAMKGKALLDAV